MYKGYTRVVNRLLMYILLTAIALVMVGPFVWSIASSLKLEQEIYRFPPTVVPSTLQWSNYVNVLRTAHFPRYFLNSTIVTVLQVIATLSIASLAAYAFARLHFPKRDLLFFLFLMGMMIPPQVTVVPKFLIIRRLNLIDTYWGIILPGLFTPFALFVFRQFFLAIPRELEEAAIIDGCSHIQMFLKIIVPLAKPVFAAMAIFRFVFCWNELLWPLVVINSEEMRVLQVGLSIFKLEGMFQYNMLMAAAVMAVIPTLAVFLIFQKYFVRSEALTGLKF